MILPDYIKKYLNKFSSGKWSLQNETASLYEMIVVVPAIAEFENLTRLIDSLKLNEEKTLRKTLFIFVINNRASDSGEVKENNYRTIEFLEEESSAKKLNIVIVDASTEGFELPEKEGGVGLARKIGMDLALRYFDYSSDKKNISNLP